MKPKKEKIKWVAKTWAILSLLYLMYLSGLLYIGISHEIDFLPKTHTNRTITTTIYHLIPMCCFFLCLSAIPYQILIRRSIISAQKYCFLLLFIHGYALLFSVHILNWNLLVFGIPYFLGLIASLFFLKTPNIT